MKKTIWIILFILVNTNLFAQDPPTKEKPIWSFNLGTSAAKYMNIEAGLGLTEFLNIANKKNKYDYFTYAFSEDISAEWLPGKNLWGPKFSFRVLNCNNNKGAGPDLILGGDYILYNDFKKVENVIRPAVGLQFLAGTVELCYGYNINLSTERHLPVNTHVIQFRLKPRIIYILLSRAWG